MENTVATDPVLVLKARYDAAWVAIKRMNEMADKDAYGAATEATSDIEWEMIHEPATSFEGVIAKLSLLIEGEFEELAKPPEEQHTETRIILEAIADIRRLCGAPKA